jgi:hypothetical protein
VAIPETALLALGSRPGLPLALAPALAVAHCYMLPTKPSQ